MRQYHDLVRHVLKHGVRKENRTGVDTLSTFGYYYEHDLRDGFPLLTTKEIQWKNIVIELLWFLSGTNGQDFLERHGIKFWRPWYRDDGKVNAAYGPAWRRFETPGYRMDETGLGYDGPVTEWNDQIKWVMGQLQTNPMRRDLVVSAWQPHIVQTPPTLKTYWAPCHCMFIFNVQNQGVDKVFHYGHNDGFDPVCGAPRGSQTRTGIAVLDRGQAWCPKCKQILNKIHKSEPFKDGPAYDDPRRLCLHLTQRSCDVALGVPYNLASYALLCSLMARFADMEAGIFGHTLVDTHIYTKKADGTQAEYDHVPGLEEQLERDIDSPPNLFIDDSIRTLEDVEALLDPSVTTEQIMKLFRIENYMPRENIKFKVAV